MRQCFFLLCVSLEFFGRSCAMRFTEKNKKTNTWRRLTDFWKNCVQWVTRLLEVRLDRNMKGCFFLNFFFTGHQKRKKKNKQGKEMTSQRQSGVHFLLQSLPGPVVKCPSPFVFQPNEKQRPGARWGGRVPAGGRKVERFGWPGGSTFRFLTPNTACSRGRRLAFNSLQTLLDLVQTLPQLTGRVSPKTPNIERFST